MLERREEILAPVDPELYETFTRMARDEDTRLIVSLGGGSVPGLGGNAALVKLLEELELRDEVDILWGTSAGAIVGGAWASGASADEIYRTLLGLSGKRMVDVAWAQVALGFLLKPLGWEWPDALIHGRRFHEVITRSLQVEHIEDCPIPFCCIACADDGTMRRHVFRRGPLATAISASMSLPGLLAPRDEQGEPTTGYYDGGLVERTPLYSPLSEHVRSGDERRALVVGTHFSTEALRPGSARGFASRFLFTIYSLEDQLWEYQVREARERSDASILILSPDLAQGNALDFTCMERNYLQAREHFKDRLQNAKVPLAVGC